MREAEILTRLSVAVVCGLIVGLQYERRSLPGGLRTHSLTAAAAALFCVMGVRLVDNDRDVLRVVQGVATGVAFIGGGVVMREGGNVRGLSNAASLWITAAIGCTAGVGQWRTALLVSLFVALVSAVTLAVERRWFHKTGSFAPPTAPTEELHSSSLRSSEPR